MSSLWYCCKYCRQLFKEAKDLISHKKLKHPTEYRADKKRRKRERRQNNNNEGDHDKVQGSDTLSSRSSIDAELKFVPKKEAPEKHESSNSHDGGAIQSPSLDKVSKGGNKSQQQCKSSTSSSSKNEKSSQLPKLSSSTSPGGRNKQNSSPQEKEDYPSASDSDNDISSEGGRKCIYCGRNFEKLVMMMKHVRIIHRTAQAFRCQFCSKKFQTVSNLNVHERNHCEVVKNNKLDPIKTQQSESGQKKNGRLKVNQCGICLKVLSTVKGLRVHMVGSHSGKAPHKCSVCDARFNWASQLSKHKKHCHHTRKVSGGRGQPSSSRSGHLKNQEQLDDYVEEEEEEEDSDILERTSISSGQEEPTVDEHDNDDGDRKTISGRQTKNVKKEFTTIPKFITPQLFEGKRVYVCDFCFKIFPQSDTARNHVITHTGERPFKCSFCSKTYARQSTLQDHERFHLGHRPYKCRYCHKKFHSTTNRSHHQILAHGPAGTMKKTHSNNGALGQAHSRHQLSSPKKKLVSKQKLKSVTSSSSEPPQQYAHCMIYVTRKERRDGRVTHACNFCNKEFSCLSFALHHIPGHTGEKHFKCSICDQLFAYDGGRRKHERNVHNFDNINKRPRSSSSGVKKRLTTTRTAGKQRTGIWSVSEDSPHINCGVVDGKTLFCCKYCNKIWNRKDHAVAHTRVHTGEKPYQCSFCEKSFGWKSNLVKHERSWH